MGKVTNFALAFENGVSEETNKAKKEGDKP